MLFRPKYCKSNCVYDSCDTTSPSNKQILKFMDEKQLNDDLFVHQSHSHLSNTPGSTGACVMN